MHGTRTVFLTLVMSLLLPLALPLTPSDFQYYREITVENTGSPLTDYQILVQIDTASLISQGKLRPDCGDIRFAQYLNGTNEYAYWIDPTTCNTSETDIWVKVPNLPTGNTTFYMFYGNPSATSQSNGSAVFDFFDDFEGGFASFWDTVDYTSISSDYAYSGSNSAKQDGSGSSYSMLKKVFDSGMKGVFTVYFRDDASDTDASAKMDGADSSGNYFAIGVSTPDVSGNYAYYDGSWKDTGISRTTAWHKLEIVSTGSGLKYRIDGNEFTTTYAKDVKELKLTVHNSWAITVYWDLFYVRKYADPEPTVLDISDEFKTSGESVLYKFLLNFSAEHFSSDRSYENRPYVISFDGLSFLYQLNESDCKRVYVENSETGGKLPTFVIDCHPSGGVFKAIVLADSLQEHPYTVNFGEMITNYTYVEAYGSFKNTSGLWTLNGSTELTDEYLIMHNQSYAYFYKTFDTSGDDWYGFVIRATGKFRFGIMDTESISNYQPQKYIAIDERGRLIYNDGSGEQIIGDANGTEVNPYVFNRYELHMNSTKAVVIVDKGDDGSIDYTQTSPELEIGYSNISWNSPKVGMWNVFGDDGYVDWVFAYDEPEGWMGLYTIDIGDRAFDDFVSNVTFWSIASWKENVNDTCVIFKKNDENSINTNCTVLTLDREKIADAFDGMYGKDMRIFVGVVGVQNKTNSTLNITLYAGNYSSGETEIWQKQYTVSPVAGLKLYKTINLNDFNDINESTDYVKVVTDKPMESVYFGTHTFSVPRINDEYIVEIYEDDLMYPRYFLPYQLFNRTLNEIPVYSFARLDGICDSDIHLVKTFKHDDGNSVYLVCNSSDNEKTVVKLKDFGNALQFEWRYRTRLHFVVDVYEDEDESVYIYGSSKYGITGELENIDYPRLVKISPDGILAYKLIGTSFGIITDMAKANESVFITIFNNSSVFVVQRYDEIGYDNVSAVWSQSVNSITTSSTLWNDEIPVHMEYNEQDGELIILALRKYDPCPYTSDDCDFYSVAPLIVTDGAIAFVNGTDGGVDGVAEIQLPEYPCYYNDESTNCSLVQVYGGGRDVEEMFGEIVNEVKYRGIPFIKKDDKLIMMWVGCFGDMGKSYPVCWRSNGYIDYGERDRYERYARLYEMEINMTDRVWSVSDLMLTYSKKYDSPTESGLYTVPFFVTINISDGYIYGAIHDYSNIRAFKYDLVNGTVVCTSDRFSSMKSKENFPFVYVNTTQPPTVYYYLHEPDKATGFVRFVDNGSSFYHDFMLFPDFYKIISAYPLTESSKGILLCVNKEFCSVVDDTVDRYSDSRERPSLLFSAEVSSVQDPHPTTYETVNEYGVLYAGFDEKSFRTSVYIVVPSKGVKLIEDNETSVEALKFEVSPVYSKTFAVYKINNDDFDQLPVRYYAKKGTSEFTDWAYLRYRQFNASISEGDSYMFITDSGVYQPACFRFSKKVFSDLHVYLGNVLLSNPSVTDSGDSFEWCLDSLVYVPNSVGYYDSYIKLGLYENNSDYWTTYSLYRVIVPVSLRVGKIHEHTQSIFSNHSDNVISVSPQQTSFSVPARLKYRVYHNVSAVVGGNDVGNNMYLKYSFTLPSGIASNLLNITNDDGNVTYSYDSTNGTVLVYRKVNDRTYSSRTTINRQLEDIFVMNVSNISVEQNTINDTMLIRVYNTFSYSDPINITLNITPPRSLNSGEQYVLYECPTHDGLNCTGTWTKLTTFTTSSIVYQTHLSDKLFKLTIETVPSGGGGGGGGENDSQEPTPPPSDEENETVVKEPTEIGGGGPIVIETPKYKIETNMPDYIKFDAEFDNLVVFSFYVKNLDDKPVAIDFIAPGGVVIEGDKFVLQPKEKVIYTVKVRALGIGTVTYEIAGVVNKEEVFKKTRIIVNIKGQPDLSKLLFGDVPDEVAYAIIGLFILALILGSMKKKGRSVWRRRTYFK